MLSDSYCTCSVLIFKLVSQIIQKVRQCIFYKFGVQMYIVMSILTDSDYFH